MTQESVAEPDPPSDGESFLWLRRSDQWFLGTLLLVLTMFLAFQWARVNGWFHLQAMPAALTPERYQYTLDINAATWVEWAQLDGIGETIARRIIRDREERGPFISIDDVSRVKGIGDKTMERIRPHLSLREDVASEESSR